MTPILHVRSFSDDQYWLDKVFYTNSYRLKGVQDRSKAPIVVDIGAHCGYFTFTALALGAKKIYSVEPFIENYKILLKNTGDNGIIIPYQLSIAQVNSAITFEYPVPEKSHVNFSNIKPNYNLNAKKVYTCPSVSLDYFLRNYIESDIIDILKINIGYQERDILSSSKVLQERVNSICGETILEPEHVATFKAEMIAMGYVNSHVIASTEEDNKIFFIFSKNEIAENYNL